MIYKTIGILTLTLLLLVTSNTLFSSTCKIKATNSVQEVAIDQPITGNGINTSKYKIAIDQPITGNSVKLPKV